MHTCMKIIKKLLTILQDLIRTTSELGARNAAIVSKIKPTRFITSFRDVWMSYCCTCTPNIYSVKIDFIELGWSLFYGASYPAFEPDLFWK